MGPVTNIGFIDSFLNLNRDNRIIRIQRTRLGLTVWRSGALRDCAGLDPRDLAGGFNKKDLSDQEKILQMIHFDPLSAL